MGNYRIWHSKTTLTTWVLFGLLISVLFTVIAIFETIPAWQWAVICGISGLGIIHGRWEYKRMYRKNVNSILKDLDELKKMESE
jgi:hypothetical protein